MSARAWQPRHFLRAPLGRSNRLGHAIWFIIWGSKEGSFETEKLVSKLLFQVGSWQKPDGGGGMMMK